MAGLCGLFDINNTCRNIYASKFSNADNYYCVGCFLWQFVVEIIQKISLFSPTACSFIHV